MSIIYKFWFYRRGSKQPNFGDDFNKDFFYFVQKKFKVIFFDVSRKSTIAFFINNRFHLFKSPLRFVRAYKERFDEPVFYGIGSILNEYNLSRSSIIFGSGILVGDKKVNFNETDDLQILALRGKKTLEVLCNSIAFDSNTIVLGDPGLLASIIYPATVGYSPKTIKNLYILHYTHKSYLSQISASIGQSDLVVTAEINPAKLCYLISISQLVISSSLHGIIFAHSYSKPAIRLVFQNDELKGGDFKFIDYLSIFDESNAFRTLEYDKVNEFLKKSERLWFPSVEEINKVHQNYLNLMTKTFSNI